MESDCDDDISYQFDDEDYNSNNDDEDYNSENSMYEEEDENEDIQSIINDPGMQFEKEMKFLYRKYSTTKVVKYHGYKYEEDRQLISNQPLLNIFSFNGNEYFYHRDALSTYQLMHSLDGIRQTEISLKINPSIISYDDSYLFLCRKKNLAIWNKHIINMIIQKENYMSIITPEDMDILLNYKNTLNNSTKKLSSMPYQKHSLNTNWILKIIIGEFTFKTLFKSSVLSAYVQSCSIKKEYDKRKKMGIIMFKDDDNINGKQFVRMSKNDRKKLYKKDKREERQNTGNNKSGSNLKTGKTQQAVRVLEEKAIVQSFTYIDKNSEDKEISPLLNKTSIV